MKHFWARRYIVLTIFIYPVRQEAGHVCSQSIKYTRRFQSEPSVQVTYRLLPQLQRPDTRRPPYHHRSRPMLVAGLVDRELGSRPILVDRALESPQLLLLQHVAIDTHLRGILVLGVRPVGHAPTVRAAVEAVVLLSILIRIRLWSFDPDVFGVVVRPHRPVAAADVAVALVELLRRRGERERHGFAVACSCAPGAGRSGHDRFIGAVCHARRLMFLPRGPDVLGFFISQHRSLLGWFTYNAQWQERSAPRYADTGLRVDPTRDVRSQLLDGGHGRCKARSLLSRFRKRPMTLGVSTHSVCSCQTERCSKGLPCCADPLRRSSHPRGRATEVEGLYLLGGGEQRARLTRRSPPSYPGGVSRSGVALISKQSPAGPLPLWHLLVSSAHEGTGRCLSSSDRN